MSPTSSWTTLESGDLVVLSLGCVRLEVPTPVDPVFWNRGVTRVSLRTEVCGLPPPSGSSYTIQVPVSRLQVLGPSPYTLRSLESRRSWFLYSGIVDRTLCTYDLPVDGSRISE